MNKLASNTITLYLRQVVILAVNLFSVRFVLSALGVEDYGTFSVVSGTVIAFGFMSGSLAIITQRYLSYAMGSGDSGGLNKIFNICLQVCMVVSFLVFISAETIGGNILENHLTIGADRREAAYILFHSSIVTFLMSILATSYIAILISHEDMTTFALIAMVEAMFKLLAAITLPHLDGDKLIWYGLFLSLISIVNFLTIFFICKLRYPNFYVTWFWDKKLLLSITSFTSWTLIGNIASVIKIQGINIIINIYFGPVVNAASAIAIQVNYAVLSLAQNLTTAVRPAIVRNYSSGDREKLLELTFISSKATFFLLLFLFLPLQLELEYLMELWLDDVPPYAVIFTRVVLLSAVFEAISYPLMTVSQATGKIKLYQILVGGTNLLNLPIGLIFLNNYASPVAVFWIVATISFLAFILRLVLVSRQIKFSMLKYAKLVLLPAALVLVLGSALPLLLVVNYHDTVSRLPLTVFLTLLSTSLSVVVVGLSKSERLYVLRSVEVFLNRLKVKK